MVKRYFRLPEVLLPKQAEAVDRPKEGQHLICGSPGTGKSVVALKRTQKYYGDGKVLLLTYYHVLRQANSQLLDFGVECQTTTKWFCDLWRYLTKIRDVPEKRHETKNQYVIDYEAVLNKFESLEISDDFSQWYLIIDEGQDLHPLWYECLLAIGFENFFVVADQNQIFTDLPSSRLDLEEKLGIESVADIIWLDQNKRNTAPIAEFCNHFYTDHTSPKPDTASCSPSTNIPILFRYSDVDAVENMVIREHRADPSQLIGLIVPSDIKRVDYIRRFSKHGSTNDQFTPTVSTYGYDQKGDVNIDFSRGGIVVLSDKSVKGIEFDIVYVVLDGIKSFSPDDDALKKRLYVLSSRAIKRLFFFQSQHIPSTIDHLLPDDPTLLKRHDI